MRAGVGRHGSAGTLFASECGLSGLCLDDSGLVLTWSPAASALYGYEPGEVLGTSAFETLFPIGDRAEEILKLARREGRWEGSLSLRPKHGVGESLPVAILPWRDDPAAFLLLAPAVRSESKGEAKFRALVESAPDAMVIVDRAGAIQLVNTQTERLFGYARKELLGRSVETLVPPRFRDEHPVHRDAYDREPRFRPMGAGLELFGLKKDGTEFPVEISLSPIETEHGRWVSSSIRDITDRKTFEIQLREKNTELERASEAKDRFLHSMSHELRTPLNAILGFTGTILMKLPGPLTEEQERQLLTVQKSARHLLSIINDLLDLTRIESGTVDLRTEPLDVRDVVQEVRETLRPLAEEKGLRFDASLPELPCPVETNNRAINQILINLTSNAIKFTDEGFVRIELLTQESSIELRIVDSGIGIRPEDGSRLFEAFTQGSSPGRRPSEGTGLGLHVSQKLAQLLGATITFESAVGKGSVFTLALPRRG